MLAARLRPPAAVSFLRELGRLAVPRRYAEGSQSEIVLRSPSEPVRRLLDISGTEPASLIEAEPPEPDDRSR